MENLDRIKKLYSDWSSAQNESKNNKVRSILEKATKESSKFIQLYTEMGEDGKKMKFIFENIWEDLSDNKMVAKKMVARSLLEADEKPPVDKAGNFFGEFGLAYTPIADIADGQPQKYSTNQMQSTVSDGDRDVLIQIRYAITSGNYSIAQALILNFWGKLSVKERVDIMTWAMNIGNYNSLIDVPQSKGVSFKSIKEKIENKKMTKEEFTDTFLRTAKEKMKAQ
jgi:hypothetical protein